MWQEPHLQVEPRPFSNVFPFMKTAIYVRVSTNDQTTENQLPDLEALAVG